MLMDWQQLFLNKRISLKFQNSFSYFAVYYVSDNSDIKYKSKYPMQPFFFEKYSQVEKAKYGFRYTVNCYDVLINGP